MFFYFIFVCMCVYLVIVVVTCSMLRLNGPKLKPPLPGCSLTRSYHMALTSMKRKSSAKQEPTRWHLQGQGTHSFVCNINSD